MADDVFRADYLHKARQGCEVLAIAETNCPDDATGQRWSRDWKEGVAFWACDEVGGGRLGHDDA